MLSLISSQAFEAALQRVQPSRASLLEKLPAELKLVLASKVPDLQSLINLALSGPEFYGFVEVHEGKLAHKIVTMTLGAGLMPLADACYNVMALKNEMEVGCEYPERFGGACGSFLDPSSDQQPNSAACKRMHTPITNIQIAKKYMANHTSIYQFGESEAKDWGVPRDKTLADVLKEPKIQRFVKASYLMTIMSWAASIRGLPHPPERVTRYHAVLARFTPWAEKQVEGMLDVLTEYWDEVLAGYAKSVRMNVSCSTDNGIADFVFSECIDALNDFRQPETTWDTERFITEYLDKKRPRTGEEQLLPMLPW